MAVSTVTILRVSAMSFVAIAGINIFDISDRLGDAIRYDNKTPFIETHAAEPGEIVTRPGGTFKVRYNYTKRPGCTGRVSYRLVGRPAEATPKVQTETDFPVGDFMAGWPAGKNVWRAATITVPAYVPPGDYLFFWKGVSDHCRASGELKPTAPGFTLTTVSLSVQVTVKAVN